MDNCRMFEPFVKQAREEKVDLLVLGECITTMRNGLDAETGAEEIPGPCVKYLGELAREMTYIWLHRFLSVIRKFFIIPQSYLVPMEKCSENIVNFVSQGKNIVKGFLQVINYLFLPPDSEK